MNTRQAKTVAIESIDYIVRECTFGFCIIEAMKLSLGTEHQRGIKYGLTQADAKKMASNFQAQFEGFGYRPEA